MFDLIKAAVKKNPKTKGKEKFFKMQIGLYRNYSSLLMIKKPDPNNPAAGSNKSVFNKTKWENDAAALEEFLTDPNVAGPSAGMGPEALEVGLRHANTHLDKYPDDNYRLNQVIIIGDAPSNGWETDKQGMKTTQQQRTSCSDDPRLKPKFTELYGGRWPEKYSETLDFEKELKRLVAGGKQFDPKDAEKKTFGLPIHTFYILNKPVFDEKTKKMKPPQFDPDLTRSNFSHMSKSTGGVCKEFVISENPVENARFLNDEVGRLILQDIDKEAAKELIADFSKSV
jgi:hypothetical protein